MGFFSGIVKAAIPAIAGSVGGPIAGAVASGLMGGGGSSGGTVTAPRATSTVVPGTTFQPVTYKTSGGTVTGTPQGDQYTWSTELAPWMTDLGQLGAGSAQGLFENYLTAAQKDPYDVASEFYQRGLTELQPEFLRQQTKGQERMFGGGRLGLKLAGAGLGAPMGTGQVSPDAFGIAAGQGKALTDLWRGSLAEGQAYQQNVLNQLSSAAEKMRALGMSPMEIENTLQSQAMAAEIARSNAIKTQTQQFYEPKESVSSVLSGDLGSTISSGVSGLLNSGFNSLFGSNTLSPTTGSSPVSNSQWIQSASPSMFGSSRSIFA